MQPDLAISVVVAKVIDIDLFRIILSRLSKQTISPNMELIILVEDEAAQQEIIDHIDLSGIGCVTYLVVGPIDDYERAYVHGYRAAQAPVVASVEDHAFPAPDWAEALLEAHRGDWAGVGTSMANANPASIWSWATLLPAYGYWIGSIQPGETNQLMRLNVSYKRDVVLGYGEELDTMFGRGGNLQDRIRVDGGKFYVTNRSSIAHLNPSKLLPSIILLLNAGRVYAAEQSARKQWNFGIRLLAALCTPVFPLIRFIKRYDQVFGGNRFKGTRFKLYISLFIGLSIRAIGNAVGFLFGPGRAIEELAQFDMKRFYQITRRDYQQLMSSAD